MILNVSLMVHISSTRCIKMPMRKANTYFQFKQFRIDQTMAAMKVCTESCVFGALIEAVGPSRILDIGTGTGLLSLMAAQKFSCPIDAVEVEERAYQQALANFQASPWSDRLSLFHSSIQEFAFEAQQCYDLILCNPPFFSNHLHSPSKARNMAMHNQTLPHSDLAEAIRKLLKDSGRAYVLHPPSEADMFDTIAVGKNLHIQKRTQLMHHAEGHVLRYITVYGKEPKEYAMDIFVIRDPAGAYTSDFVEKLKPYYLYL